MKHDKLYGRILALDLEPILFSLVEKEEGPQWSLERALHAEKWYRRFLFLACKYPNKVVVPSKEIDEVWHTHILDTCKYMSDCDEIFGQYIHHYPYLGQRGASDALYLKESFQETLLLFQKHFGSTPLADSSICGGTSCDRVFQATASRERLERPRLSVH